MSMRVSVVVVDCARARKMSTDKIISLPKKEKLKKKISLSDDGEQLKDVFAHTALNI